jgi:hypothetical protein
MARDEDETVRLPPGSAWRFAGPSPVRHAYPLGVRDPSLRVAIGLLLRSLPFAMVRFAVLLVTSILVIVWLAVALGGAAWLGEHIATAFGWVWAIGCLGCGAYFWGTIIRYALHLIECGHVAVLTELMTKGVVGNGNESMFAYGKQVVRARIGQETLLFGLNALVRGVVESLHRTMDWIAEMLPIPGLESIASIVNIVLKGATRYLDKVIFSYTLARGDEDPWRSSREGLVYYAQNAPAVLKTALWSVVLERLLTVAMAVFLLIPAALITLALPHALREMGGVMTILVALLLAGPLRAAFIKPLFLIMMMVRFHSIIENQAIDAAWDDRLSSISDGFRNLGQQAAMARGVKFWR